MKKQVEYVKELESLHKYLNENNFTADQIKKLSDRFVKDSKGKATHEEVEKSFPNLALIAKKTSKEEFIKMFETKELPPLKLSSKEMEKLRAGFLPYIALGIAVCWYGYSAGKDLGGCIYNWTH